MLIALQESLSVNLLGPYVSIENGMQCNPDRGSKYDS